MEIWGHGIHVNCMDITEDYFMKDWIESESHQNNENGLVENKYRICDISMGSMLFYQVFMYICVVYITIFDKTVSSSTE